MKTLDANQFPFINPPNSKGTHKTLLLRKKRYFTEQTSPDQQTNKSIQQNNKSIQSLNTSKSQQEESPQKKKLSKKYLYFHQSKIRSKEKKITFPYNALNISYIQQKIQDNKSPITRKNYHKFNSNNSIRNFLNSKLKTQPIKQEQSPQKQIFIGKKLNEQRIHNDKNIKSTKILSNISKYISVKNSIDSTKCEKLNNRFPSVLKIKSKKAYFMSRFKAKPQVAEQQNETINYEEAQNLSQEEENPFELKFRSRTQDNINMINLMRQQIKLQNKQCKLLFRQNKQSSLFDNKGRHILDGKYRNEQYRESMLLGRNKEKNQIKRNKNKKQIQLDPWQSNSIYGQHSIYGDCSFKIDQNSYY